MHARALVLVQVATDAGLRGCLSTVWPVSPETTLLVRHPEIRFSTSASYPWQRGKGCPYRVGAPKRLPRANLWLAEHLRQAGTPVGVAGRVRASSRTSLDPVVGIRAPDAAAATPLGRAAQTD